MTLRQYFCANIENVEDFFEYDIRAVIAEKLDAENFCRRFLKKSIVEASVDEVIASFNTYSSLLIDSMYNVSEEDKCYQRMTIADGGYKKLKLEYNDNYELTNPELDD